MSDSLEHSWDRFKWAKHPDLREESRPYRMLQEAFFLGCAAVLMRVQEDVARIHKDADAKERGNAVLTALVDMVTELEGMQKPKEKPVLIT
jgi:hypothetical protein